MGPLINIPAAFELMSKLPLADLLFSIVVVQGWRAGYFTSLSVSGLQESNGRMTEEVERILKKVILI
jgi:hypothetical protein